MDIQSLSNPTRVHRIYLSNSSPVKSLDKTGLARLDNTIKLGSGVSPSNHAVDREVRVKVRKHLCGTRDVSPVPHEVANDREQADDLHTCVSHPVIGDLADEGRRAARGLGIGPDRVSRSSKRQGEMGRADIGDNSSKDDLSLAGSLDSSLEVLVVPGIDFTLALDESCVGVHASNLLWQGSVGA